MKVKAKVSGERQISLPEGGVWGVVFTKGETLHLPAQAFHPDLFLSCEKPKAIAPDAKR